MQYETMIPKSVTDVILHDKDKDNVERVILPVTRYKNILNAPRLVYDTNSIAGSPFSLYVSESESVSLADLKELIPNL